MIKRSGLTGFLIFILCFISYPGCSDDSDSPLPAALSFFYDKMRETTPVYEPLDNARQTKALVTTGEWTSQNAGILYSVFFTLRDYQSPRDEGIVDRSNFYKLLYDAETVFSGAYSRAAALASPVQIASPFAGIDTSATTFTNAANIENDSLSAAFFETAQKIEALVTWKWLEENNPDKAERGIAYYTYAKSTQDITIDMVFSVDYDISTAATDYNLRCKASGNVADHSFQFNYLIGNNQIIAKGISQGEDNYVVFKFSDGSGPYYLRVNAAEGEDFFKDVFDNGSTIVKTNLNDISDPEDYLTWIEAQSFMTAADLLTTTVSLNTGISGLAGTINLNY